jgi:hypothetical protein
MVQKKILRPDRLRQMPPQFSWIDQRLVRDNLLPRGEPIACALYLVLVIVADAQGLSYYSDATLSRLLKLEPLQLARARQQLIAGDLLAYQKPLYQVLALPPASTPASPQRSGQALSVGDILRRAVEGGAV